MNALSIPDYESLMLPILSLASDKKEKTLLEMREILIKEFDLTDEEVKEMLPSGAIKFFNRMAWAKTYLKKAGLIQNTRRGHFKITKRGIDLLRTKPQKIDNDILSGYKEFLNFKNNRNNEEQKEENENNYEKTPEESMDSAFNEINAALSSEIMDQILNSPPEFFEKLVVNLLVKMGYGGSVLDAGKAVGKVNDEGIDGLIKEDKLGLDIIYIQAKRWRNVVSRPEIQKFVGALEGKKARKGVFITTSKFTKGAIDYTENLNSKVVLIDGEKLTEYMIENNVGVFTERSYEIKRIDMDFFSLE